MKAEQYLTKIRYLIFAIMLGLSWGPAVVRADGEYDVNFRVIDARNAEIKITYPVPPGAAVITALSTKKVGSIMDGYRDLTSANAQDGSPRTIKNNTLTTDSQIVVQPGDQKITLTYNLTNTLNSDNVSLFNFLLFFGTEYPQKSNIKISAPSGFDILAHSKGVNTQKANDGSIVMDMQSDQSPSTLLAKNFRVLVYPKSTSSYYSKSVGRFTVTADKTKLSQISSVLDKISFAPDMFQKILGAALPDKINIVVTSIKGQTAYYEPAGIFLEPNIILIDPSDLFFDVGPNDPQKTIVHELGHMAVANKGIFSNQLYYSRWLDEGIAVFSEQYATDNYILKNDQDRQIDTVLSGIKKMTIDELKSAYEFPFDYNFSINSSVQPIARTYSHAGLIMYNLYLRDPSIISNILDALKSESGNVTCKDCDTNTALDVIKGLSGLSKEEIIYPYKNNLTTTNPLLSRLIIENVDPVAAKKIKNSASANVGSYIDKDAKVETFEVTGTKNKPTPEAITSTSTSQKGNGAEDDTNVGLSEDNQNLSFFQRIKRWIRDLLSNSNQ